MFIDSKTYDDWEEDRYTFFGSNAAESLDLKNILDYLARQISNAGFDGERTLRKHCIPAYEAEEIRERQGIIQELYEDEEIAYKVSSIITSAPNLHNWTTRYIARKTLTEKIREAEEYVSTIETASTLNAKSKRLKQVEKEARQIKEQPEYKALKEYVDLRIGRELLQELPTEHWPESTRLGDIIESYRKITTAAEMKAQRYGALDVESRRELYKAIRSLQTIFSEFIHNPALDMPIEKEAKAFKLEEELEKSIEKMTGLESRQKASAAERYFHQQFGSTLEHITRLISEALDTKMKDHNKMRQTAKELAFYDSLARLARKMGNIVLPEISEKTDVKGAHTPSETLRKKENTPNDFSFGKTHGYLITGANNNGKTTYQRMVGQCQILAQLGSYIPAQSARIRPVRNIFTSFGQKDNPDKKEGSFLSSLNYLGFMTQPQFYEEDETIPIKTKKTLEQTIKTCLTPHAESLLLLDEIAIGSDNISTEKALTLVMRLCQQRKSRMLLTTHYHPIAEKVQEGTFKGIMNLGAKTQKGRFTYKMIRGKHKPSLGHLLFEEAGFTEKKLEEGKELFM